MILGFATGAFEFDLGLQPGASAERTLGAGPPRDARPAAVPLFDWKAQMRTDQWSGSGWAGEAIEAALTATTHILITRSGPALQPGPRRYTRSWIRDGAMMSAALLRMGHVREVLEFIRWYAPHQRDDGFVPCCVDREGPDWLVEHDSHGQMLALIADHHRFTGDRQFLRGDLARHRQGRAVHRGTPGKRRTHADIGQPRGLSGTAGSFLLGRFLDASRPR